MQTPSEYDSEDVELRSNMSHLKVSEASDTRTAQEMTPRKVFSELQDKDDEVG